MIRFLENKLSPSLGIVELGVCETADILKAYRHPVMINEDAH